MGQRHGQVVLVGAQGAQRRKLRAKLGMNDLEHLLRPAQVGQAMFATTPQGYLIRQVIADEVSDHPRAQHLPTRTHRHQPGSAAERRAEIVRRAAVLTRNGAAQLHLARARAS
jgi:hypothetical protein